MHCSLRLIIQTLVFSLSYLHRQVSPPEWARNGRWILLENARLPLTFRDLLYALHLRHGTNGFTSLPKEGVLRIFSPWKIRRLRPDLNPRIWVPKASTLPLDHQSRFNIEVSYTHIFIHTVLMFKRISLLRATVKQTYCIQALEHFIYE